MCLNSASLAVIALLLLYRTAHGVGSQPFAVSGSFLKCELVINGSVKYSGSSTIVVTTMYVLP